MAAKEYNTNNKHHAACRKYGHVGMILEGIRQKYTVTGKIVQDYKSGNRGIDEIGL